MSLARHAADSVRMHLNYGKLTVSHVHKYLMEERERQQRLLVQPARAPLMCERRNGLEGVGLNEHPPRSLPVKHDVPPLGPVVRGLAQNSGVFVKELKQSQNYLVGYMLRQKH